MLGISLSNTYSILLDRGFVRSKRDYAKRWLGKGKTYVRDFEHRPERSLSKVGPSAVQCLRSRLTALKEFFPPTLVKEADDLLQSIDRDCRVAIALSRSPLS